MQIGKYNFLFKSVSQHFIWQSLILLVVQLVHCYFFFLIGEVSSLGAGKYVLSSAGHFGT